MLSLQISAENLQGWCRILADVVIGEEWFLLALMQLMDCVENVHV